MPRFSDDDVVDLLVTEAVVVAAKEAENEQVEQQKHKEQVPDPRAWAEANGLIAG